MLYANVVRPKLEPKLDFPIARYVGGTRTLAPILQLVHDLIMAQTKQSRKVSPDFNSKLYARPLEKTTAIHQNSSHLLPNLNTAPHQSVIPELPQRSASA